ncbi:MAG: VOC family protein [Chloroflexi bacterium]|nr:VOC family protein [Chloroflexota bacterium]MCI0783669.1 VOC family protein [Chloroflexota bacterium]MCI0815072.1 VOC family protein [Chloroflexota bacterium]MCI0817872.1 VOC family protein [Chloroflexota bacterium]MCI0820216.1 VOC family protein [Chloroflexota bacterium]
MTNERPVLNQINLVVKDMDAMVTFYRSLGLEIPDTDPAWQAHHRTAAMPEGLDLDFDSDEFAQQWNRGWRSRGKGAMGVLGFHVSSREAVDELYEGLTNAGYHGQQVPYDAFWGARYAIVEDPDGNAVGLMSPIDPARRTTPTPP